MQKKLAAAQRATPEEIEAAYRAIEEWRRYEPEVDLYVSPCYASSSRPRRPTSSRCGSRLTSFLRWVNLTGWAGLAIGNMQFVAPRDEVVLAAGLAWEAAELLAAELGRALLRERLDALAEVVRLLEEPVGEPFELEPLRSGPS